MVVNYDKDFFKMIYYKNVPDIEIIETSVPIEEGRGIKGEIKKYHFGFKNIGELFNLLKSDKRLFKELKIMFEKEMIRNSIKRLNEKKKEEF